MPETVQDAKIAGPWEQFVLQAASDQNRYADLGQWSAVAFMLTGDEAHAKEAIRKAESNWPTLNKNNVREHLIELTILYGKLNDYMTPTQRGLWEARLGSWAWEVLKSTRDGDSDEVVGYYFGIRMVDEVCGTAFCEQSARPDSMSADQMRETIKSYIAKASNGEWIESGTKYNHGTCSLMLMGVAALGPQEFSEVLEWIPQLSEQMTWHITADGKDSVQWGDVEDPHGAALYQFVTLAGQVIALGGDKSGDLANLLACRIAGRPVSDYGLNLHRVLWAGFDPNTLPANPVWPNPQGLRVANVGLVLYRKGNTLVQLMLPNELGVDHRVHASNARVYDAGEWIIDAPIGYSYQWQLHNGPRGFGFGSMHERQLVATTETADGFSAIWTTGGNLRGPWAGNNQPREFVKEMRLTVHYKHATRSLRVHTSFQGSDPDLAQTGGPGLIDSEREIIAGAPARWQWLQHTPTKPTATPDGFTWKTDSGRLMELKTGTAKRTSEKLVDNVNVRGTYTPHELRGWMIRLLDDSLPATEIELTIQPTGAVAPPVDPQVDPPPKPPVVVPPVELPRIFRRGDVEFRVYGDRLERVEIFPFTP